ncbi:MAG: hypothetical protein KF841_03135 [Phycisphaerae bacterium]|nr:hypothetical protein [Phycisphaerae bacterium]
MSQEWLDIQSFFSDLSLLQAINDLSIGIKHDLAGVSDPDRRHRVQRAQETLRRFFAELQRLADVPEQERFLGLDERLKELATGFENAQRDASNFHSTLMRAGPGAAATLLDAKDRRAKQELLDCLAELRRVVSRHQQANVSAIVEDF